MKILGIESSCDETAAAVVDGRTILSSIVSSQLDLHAEFGGVVPELASRAHLSSVGPVVARALAEAGATFSDLDGIAATYGPGLIGALLVGLNFAKGLASARNLPFVGVNHLDGHLNAAFLESDTDLDWPFVALLVSGGHTHLYDARAFGDYRLIGRTRDDAAGEAFDKVAQLLELGYPGGPAIDRAATSGDARRFGFPRAMPDSTDFSFSGLKTAVLLQVRKIEDLSAAVGDLAASFQEAVVDSLTDKALRAAIARGHGRLVVSGGVAANSRLRTVLSERAAGEGVRVYFPSGPLCTDNAAMIAWVGHQKIERGERSNLTLNASAVLPLARA